jgi:rod shape-determining protein MreD
MVRLLLLMGLLAGATVIDGAWLSRLPLPAAPELAMLVALAVGMRRGLEAGALAGAAAGYLYDLVSGSPLGLYTLAYLAVGAAAGAVRPVVDLRQRSVPVVAAVLGTSVVYLISALLVAATALAHVDWTQTARDAAVAAIGNALLARPVDSLVGWVEYVSVRRHAARVIPHKAGR